MKTTTLHVPSCTRFRLHFRYLAALLLAPALLLAADAKEDEPEPDFKSNSFRIRINHYTPATAAELERIGKDEPVEVSLNKPCTMEDFESICKHTWIEELKIENGNEHIDSIAPVASLTKLRSFIIRSPKKDDETPFDLAPLAGLTELEKQELYACSSTNADALKGLSKLRDVSFYMADIDSLDFLAGTPEIERLELYGFGHTFENYQPVVGLKKLKELGVYMNKQAVDEKLAVLSALTALEKFSMSNCKKVTTLDFLSGSAASLKKLRANWCEGLTDFSALHEMVNMEDLDVWRMPTKDFSFIEKMPKLKSLGLRDNEIADLSIFGGLKDLKSLSLDQDCIPADAEEQIKKLLPDLRFTPRT